MNISELRPYTDADHESLLELIGGIYADYGFGLDLHDIDRHLNDPAAFRPEGEFWVLGPVGEVAACVAARVYPDYVELKSLYVHSSLRRRGLGRALTLRVEDFARRTGRQDVVLWSDTRFADAHRLYERLGYVKDDVRHFEDVNETSEFRFSKKLAAIGTFDGT